MNDPNIWTADSVLIALEVVATGKKVALFMKPLGDSKNMKVIVWNTDMEPVQRPVSVDEARKMVANLGIPNVEYTILNSGNTAVEHIKDLTQYIDMISR